MYGAAWAKFHPDDLKLYQKTYEDKMRKSPFREMDKMLLSSRDVGRVLFYKITDLVQKADYKPVDYRTCASSRAVPGARMRASVHTHARMHQESLRTRTRTIARAHSRAPDTGTPT
jgi:hypothetical protein